MHGKARNGFRSLLFLLLGGLTMGAGCPRPIVSRYPLSEEVSTRENTRLAGFWQVSGLQDYQYAHTSVEEDSISFLLIGDDNKVQLFEGWTTVLAGKNHLNLSRGLGYIFARYELKGDVLTVWPLESKPSVIEAVKKKRLKGRLSKDETEVSLLTDRPDKLTAYIRANGDKMLGEPITFHRIALPAKEEEASLTSDVADAGSEPASPVIPLKE